MPILNYYEPQVDLVAAVVKLEVRKGVPFPILQLYISSSESMRIVLAIQLEKEYDRQRNSDVVRSCSLLFSLLD